MNHIPGRIILEQISSLILVAIIYVGRNVTASLTPITCVPLGHIVKDIVLIGLVVWSVFCASTVGLVTGERSLHSSEIIVGEFLIPLLILRRLVLTVAIFGKSENGVYLTIIIILNLRATTAVCVTIQMR